jgi:VanZ family protein
LERNPTGRNDLPEPTQKAHWLTRWWPAIAWAIVISLFSNHAFTSENTGRYIIPALHWLLPHSSMARLAAIHHYIRKTGHLTEYFILSLLLLRGIRGERKGMRLAWAFWAIVIVLCYASLDEFHQRFVPGRTPAVSDVMLDTTGGILAQAVIAAIWKRPRARFRGILRACLNREPNRPTSTDL